MINKNFRTIYYVSCTLLIFCLVSFLSLAHHLNASTGYSYSSYDFTKPEDRNSILSDNLLSEGCFECHSDMYPNQAYDPNDPNSPNYKCFINPEEAPYPLFYSTYDPDPNLPSDTLSLGYLEKFREDYEDRKKGHLTHLVYQPFGLGRTCLDCHDPNHYKQDPADPNGHDKEFIIYFKGYNNPKNTTLKNTKVCDQCHGGFYPKGSEVLPENPEIDPNSVRLLRWGDPGSVTCLQCHDDSYEHGGEYASYISRYCSFPNFHYEDPNGIQSYPNFHYDPNGCLLTAPDPDTVPRQNYWPKNGHGVTAQKSYAGATLDTGYPDPNRPTYPNKGATNSKNIPIDPNDPNPHSHKHDLNLNPDDGRKNFCLECHWSNETVWEKVCVESTVAHAYPYGFPIGKYNGHLDTTQYRDERWGSTETAYPDVCKGLRQWDICRECHPTKHSHFIDKELGNVRRSGPQDRASHCIACHNPHGSGDEQGKANVFMIKRRIYKAPCKNCHYSQFQVGKCDPFADYHPDLNDDTWVVDFLDPLKQDIIEPNSSENFISIPAGTTDICEVCHQDKPREYWPNPGGDEEYDYRHRNGSRHYFNPDNDPCLDPNTCTIDYRDSDCTGCHIHDPGPVPNPDDPNYDYEIGNTRSVFNSKAFAPTCRCHGIGRIDIATLDYDPNEYRGEGSLLPDIAGKGHGIPPPPFPIVDPNLPDKDPNQDPHMAHAKYNFPCIACHIDPTGPLYDPNDEYIFVLDDYTPVGINKFMNPNDQLMNPNGIYEESTQTCFNLYCHSNAKGDYADPNAWSEADKFCRNPNNPDCLDVYGRFLYCNECHKNPPDDPNQRDSNNPYNITDHTVDLSQPDPNIRCSTCHPHNGLYKEQRNGIYISNPGFYKHVDGKVDIGEIIYTFEPIGCGYCHIPDDPDLDFHNLNVPVKVSIEDDFPRGSCLYCHSTEHKEMILCDPNVPDIDSQCTWCHQETLDDPESDFGCDSDKNWLHSADAECTSCHNAICDPNTIHHYEYGNSSLPLSIEQNWNDGKGCGTCHEDIKNPFNTNAKLHDNVNTDCQECHGRHCDMNIVPSFRKDISNTCGACHEDPKIPGGSTLHAPVLDMSCEDCHGSHRTAEELRDYLDDYEKCEHCHGDPPSMNIVINGVPVSGTHPPEATDCEACHPGVRDARNHYQDAGDVNLEQSWQGPNSCGICHSDVPAVACGGVPSLIHATLGPRPDCSFCHYNHSETIYWDTPSKCIACHGPNPEICDICGPGNLTTHYAFDTFGINQAAIQDCIFCHVEPLTGGEANPLNHIDNPMTYVNPLTCLGCHSVVVPHGGSGLPWAGGLWPAVNCYSCHPTHCVSTYCDNQACVWCHTDAPLLQNVCGKPVLVPHTGDCMGCHAGGSLTGGECNAVDHMNGLTYVRDGTCLGCHANITTTHGPGTETCSLCHPVHCSFAYCSETQCKTCHNFQNMQAYGTDGSFPISSDYGCVSQPDYYECVDQSDYGAVSQKGIEHEPPAYRGCNSCHKGECNPQIHRIKPDDIDPFINPDCTKTDLSGMIVTYSVCELCHHPNPQMKKLHLNCAEIPCQGCHYPGISNTCLVNNHLCVLDYRDDEKCRCCHDAKTEIYPNHCEDHNGRPKGIHSPEAFSSDCEDCHTNEYMQGNHANGFANLSNMSTNDKCILCHNDTNFNKIHKNINNRSCTECHLPGTDCQGDNHLCNTQFCDSLKCLICHPEDMLNDPYYIETDYCKDIYGKPLTGPHPTDDRVPCTSCHGGECEALNHMDSKTDVSNMTNMTFDISSCGLCHNDPDTLESHKDCEWKCGSCHTGTTNHKCDYDFNYCEDDKCKCCHIGPIFNIDSDYGCSLQDVEHEGGAYKECIRCHNGECDRSNHRIKGEDEGAPADLSGMMLEFSDCELCHTQAKAFHLRCIDPDKCKDCHLDNNGHFCETNYTYNRAAGDHDGCNCCHGHPPQCVCVGISDTQDHCLAIDQSGAVSCDVGIYTCEKCHIQFTGKPDHIREPYEPDVQINSCICHGASLGSAHERHLNSEVMKSVYIDSNYTIACNACHPPAVDLDNHVVCDDTAFTVDVVFDSTLAMIGTGDYFDPGTGICYIYCHSDGDNPPNATGTYTYYVDPINPNITGIPPEWNQTTGKVSCGNSTIGFSLYPIYQCHGYPPAGHPMPTISPNCLFCHPTPAFWNANFNIDPDLTIDFHINGEVKPSPGGPGGGIMPVI